MNGRSGCICVGLVVIATVPVLAGADRKPSEGQGLSQAVILSAAREARGRVRSGSVKVTGFQTVKGAAKDFAAGPLDMTVDFDLDEGLYRIDRREPGATEKSATIAGEAPLSDVGGVMLSLPDKVIVWRRGGNNIAYVGLPRSTLSDGAVRPFDLRLVGMVGLSSLDRGIAWDASWELVAKPATSVVGGDDGKYRLVWLTDRSASQGGSSRLEIDFDSTRGWGPIAYRTYLFQGPTGEDAEPVQSQEVEWEEVSGEWVPVNWKTRRRVVPPDGVIEREVTFLWSKIDRGEDIGRWTIETLGLPVGVRVVDTRLGEAVSVSHEKPRTMEDTSGHNGISDGRRRGAGGWIVAINVAVVVCIALAVGIGVYRRRKRDGGR